MKKKHIIALILSLSLTFLLSLSSLITSISLYKITKLTNNSFLIGNTLPLIEQGNNNDIYLDSSSLNIYKKIDGSWTYILTLKDSSILKEKDDDESKKKEEEIKVLHKVEVNNDTSINGDIIPHLKEAYYLDTLIFLAKPINEDYILNKLFFNDKEVSYEVAFIEGYALYSSLMIDEDIVVRAEFSLKVE